MLSFYMITSFWTFCTKQYLVSSCLYKCIYSWTQTQKPTGKTPTETNTSNLGHYGQVIFSKHTSSLPLSKKDGFQMEKTKNNFTLKEKTNYL